jgi:hypothetical protein
MATPAANIATVVIATTVHPKRELGWPCVASAVENPEHKPGRAVDFRGGRYISAEASARGEWKPGGSKIRTRTL